MKHQAGTLALSGVAPGRVTVRMGSRVYVNDALIDPAPIACSTTIRGYRRCRGGTGAWHEATRVAGR